MIYKYYLSLGSNIEPRMNFIKRAVLELKKIGTLKKKSSIYKTQAWGFRNQPDFLNAVIEFHANFEPEQFLVKIKEIEILAGRLENNRWGPREIDIDIIFCDDLSINKAGLIIPHKDFEKRKFVLIPLLELNEKYVIKGMIKKISEYITNCQDDSIIERLNLVWQVNGN